MANIYGTTGNDSLVGTSFSDWIYGYAEGTFPEDETGNDSLRGGDGNDRIFGGGGNDTLRGDEGSDQLNGGDGDDILYGGTGYDTLDGGAGDDLFVIGDANYDRFIGGSGSDTVQLGDNGFYQQFFLDDIAGVEVLDLNGFALSGSAFSDDFDISGVATVLYGGRAIDLGAGQDEFIGHAGADRVLGNSGHDTLIGGAGNDTLSGGQGLDLLDGGAGDDLLLTGDDNTDTFLGGSGTDTVRLEGAVSRYQFLLGTVVGVERLDCAGFTLAGSSSSDRFDLSGVQQLLNQRGVIDLGSREDRYVGYRGNDSVNGGSGFDTLIGGAGNDYLDGGSADDSLVGGTGSDRYVVDSLRDVVDETGGGGLDLVRSSVSFDLTVSATVRGALENLILTGGAQIDGTGNSLANAITGNGAANRLSGGGGADTLTGGGGGDVLDGGSGADRMIGGVGNDRYIVNHGLDRVIEAANGGNADTVLSSIDLRLAANVENLVLTGAARRGTGNDLGNRLTGNAEHNVLSGAGGNDGLTGGGGNDTLAGDAGNDRLSGGAGGDLLNGGTGRDVLLGGAGQDRLAGGASADSFVFDQRLRSSNVDHVLDFRHGDGDRLQFDRDVFRGIERGQLDEDAFHRGTRAGDAEDRFIYDARTGRLWFDSDGAGGAAQKLVAIFDNHAVLSSDDFYLI